ncbi:MAG: hypothetical protein PWQ67_33 [Clostridia bacterium]|jgi:glutamate synthase domain-containing protein 3|nr:hypothetical protein [Clostridia bacterium]MDN5321579.1 hypothetical protein [Clostridia bacterium]
MSVVIDAKGIYYKDLNERIREVLRTGVNELVLDNVNGQRYIGDGISGSQTLVINGTPGNDMAAYMDGLKLIINGNAQDAIGNTMNDGIIIIHGNAGDTLGYAMRGGEIYVKGNVGYRVGIHMKGYKDKNPVIVVGGRAGDFFAEYMAGGIQIVLGLDLPPGEKIVGDFCGTGMHGGVIYLRGEVEEYQLGKEVKVVPVEEEDLIIISKYVKNYAEFFNIDYQEIMQKPFVKLIPYNTRPYGNLYAKY